ncbi:hypothetical protein LGW19_10125 [Streptococcus mutans]|nr:hypothetical protein [Streptococcus mutans]
MNHMSVYLKNKVLTENFIDTPTYVGLYNGDEEVAATSYERQPVSFNAATDGQITNSKDVLFPIAKETWGAITHVGLFDATSNGNQLFKAPAEYVKNIDVSSQYKIPDHYLIVRVR